MSTAVVVLMVVAGLQLIGAVWFSICNERTCRQRYKLIDALWSTEDFAAFRAVSYEAHLRALFFFHDPSMLYPQWLRPSLSTSQHERVAQ